MKKLCIIGCGMGKESLLTKEASERMISCDEIYAFDRISELFQHVRHDIIRCSYAGLFELIDFSDAQTIGVLVSGDVGFFSIAKNLTVELGKKYEIETLCGISSLQYFCAKIHVSYENVEIVSLHGRDNCILGCLAYNRYTFVLTGGANNAADILIGLAKADLPDIRVTSGEMLSMQGERIRNGAIAEMSCYLYDSLTVLFFENPNPFQKEKPLFDKDLFRDKAPMTKQDVRWASTNYLKINPEDTIYDIGAGTGSVSIEMARKAYKGIVYAIEKNRDAYDLLERNKKQMGAFNVISILGNAKDEIINLPIPDKAFIGGSSGELPEIIEYLHNANPNILFVINAITLETLSSAMDVLKRLQFEIQITCMNCAKNNIVGEYNLMMASNPVYIITGEKNAD